MIIKNPAFWRFPLVHTRITCFTHVAISFFHTHIGLQLRKRPIWPSLFTFRTYHYIVSSKSIDTYRLLVNLLHRSSNVHSSLSDQDVFPFLISNTYTCIVIPSIIPVPYPTQDSFYYHCGMILCSSWPRTGCASSTSTLSRRLQEVLRHSNSAKLSSSSCLQILLKEHPWKSLHPRNPGSLCLCQDILIIFHQDGVINASRAPSVRNSLEQVKVSVLLTFNSWVPSHLFSMTSCVFRTLVLLPILDI